MMIVERFIYTEIPLWENKWNMYLSMKGLQGSMKSRIKIHESSAKLPKICTKQLDDEVISGDLVIDEMTAEVTKDKLKERGNTTKIS